MTRNRDPTKSFTPTPTARWWEMASERRIKCPSGHHIPFAQRINETGFIQCRHYDATAKREGRVTVECGCWVFVFAIRGDGVVVVQVTLDEMEEMRELQTPAAMLSYLQIWPTRRAG